MKQQDPDGWIFKWGVTMITLCMIIFFSVSIIFGSRREIQSKATKKPVEKEAMEKGNSDNNYQAPVTTNRPHSR